MNFGDRPIFEFTVPGPALSAQAKNRQRLRIWRETIADQARRALVDRPILIDELELRLTEFSEHRRSDRDNIAKPIQDAMEGILYANDRQVTRIKVEWCDIDGRYRVRHMSTIVAAALSAGREFIWIRIFLHRARDALIE